VSRWENQYRAAVIVGDVLSVASVSGAVAFALLLRHPAELPHWLWMSLVSAFVVLASLPACRAWQDGLLGQGPEEYRALGRGFLSAAIGIGIIGLATKDMAVRPFIFGVIPITSILALAARYILRQILHHYRRNGRCLLPVMAAGSSVTVQDLITRTRRSPHLGWRVEAACITGDHAEKFIDGVPIVGELPDVVAQVNRGGYRIVAVTADAQWDSARLQRLAWDLEGTTADIVVAPPLMEVAGPRLHVSGVLGIPMLRLSSPVFTGFRRVVKEITDRFFTIVGLTLLSPVLVAIALLVKLEDRGPIIYRQQRVGKDGLVFTIYKFRTMIPNADQVRDDLFQENVGAGPLFKVRTDPRVTRVGSILRRYSLDELPQLFNVLLGTMSLVGPRPPLPTETAEYGPYVGRRLLVKPGLTGLWQVSGRSDLPWEEAVRLDLRYVEDWSLTLDFVIMWKTVRAVLSGNGAY
jgi:exopolysaccharide biosynthesis polyprenyl glycosylphosphotransferase